METKTKETTVTTSAISSTEPQRSTETSASSASTGAARDRGYASRERDYEPRYQERRPDRDRDYDRDRYSSRERDYDRDRYSSRERDYDRDRDHDRLHSRSEEERSAVDSRDRGYQARRVWQEAPLVIELDDEYDRDGRRYSRGLRDPQLFERDFTRAAERLAGAVAEGIAVYRDARDRSADRERDGAVRDFFSNVGEGLSEAMRDASRVPRDLTRSSPRTTDRLGRQIRNMVRPFFRMYFR